MAAPPELDEYDRIIWQRRGNKCCVCNHGAIFKKHHCRKCGRVVHTGDDCSSEMVIIDKQVQQSLCLNPDGSDDCKIENKLPIRICNICQKNIRKKHKTDRKSRTRRNTRKCCHCSKRLGRISHHCRLCGKRVHKNKCSVKAILDHARQDDLILNPNGTDDPKKALRFCVGCLRTLQDKRTVPDIYRSPEPETDYTPPTSPTNVIARQRKAKTLPRPRKPTNTKPRTKTPPTPPTNVIARQRKAKTLPRPRKPTNTKTRTRSLSDGGSNRIANLNDIFEPIANRERIPNIFKGTSMQRSRSPSYKDRFTTKRGSRRAFSLALRNVQTDIGLLRIDDEDHQEQPPEQLDERENSVSESWISVVDREESVSKTAEPEHDDDVDILPSGWTECYTSDGYKYYQHNETKEVSWIFPRSSEPRIFKLSPPLKNKKRPRHARSQSMPAFLNNMTPIKEDEEDRRLANGSTGNRIPEGKSVT